MERLKYVVSHPLTINGVKVENDIKNAIFNIEHKRASIARFEFGDSMDPLLVNGEYAIIRPITAIDSLKKGDIVLCRVNGYDMTHMISRIISENGKRTYVIGDTHGFEFGPAEKIYGIGERTKIVYCGE